MKIFKRLCCFVIILLLSVYFSNCTSSSESKTKKQVVSFNNVWFSEPDAVDNDGDGYYSYLHLNFDLDVSSGSTDLFIKVYYRYTDPLDTALYGFYMESVVFTIDGSTDADAKYISIGSPNGELQEGSYDFMIWVFKESDPNNAILELASYNDDVFEDVLTDIPVEESITDAALTIADAYWDNVVDSDQDGYATQADLIVDIDVNLGITTYAYLAIYQKSYSSSSYNLLAVTENFTVNGASSADAVAYTVVDLPYDLYDFMIEVYYDVGYNAEDTADPISDPELNDVQFELSGNWIWYDDSVYESDYSSTSPSDLAVRFNKPTGTTSCAVRELYLYTTQRNASYSYARFKLWDSSIHNYPNSSLYESGDVFIAYDGDNYYPVDVDISALNVFFAGYRQNYGSGFYIAIDTSNPDSRSYEYTTDWNVLSSFDLIFRIYVEYTITKNKNSVETHGEWLDVTAAN